ncbi:MAG: hypothetical protein ACXQT5_03585 [Candidatus Syntropharchaeia archaeon]
MKGLETEEERQSVYAQFVERMEKFVTQEGKWQRKIWGCFRTTEGAKNRDIMMSVIGTMKIQNKDFFTAGKEYILSRLT